MLQPNQMRITFGSMGRGSVVGYKHLWIKSVEGFRHDVHCARCLKGHFVRPMPQVNEPLTLTVGGPILAFYVCGVSYHGYASNLHVPIVPDPDAAPIKVRMTDHQWLTVEGARILEIPPLQKGWQGLTKPFWSCRNFQFAVAAFGYPPGSTPCLFGSDRVQL